MIIIKPRRGRRGRHGRGARGVFAGEELIDPDTGKSPFQREYVGKVEVVRINPKVTYAKIVEELDAQNSAHWCRRYRASSAEEERSFRYSVIRKDHPGPIDARSGACC